MRYRTTRSEESWWRSQQNNSSSIMHVRLAVGVSDRASRNATMDWHRLPHWIHTLTQHDTTCNYGLMAPVCEQAHSDPTCHRRTSGWCRDHVPGTHTHTHMHTHRKLHVKHNDCCQILTRMHGALLQSICRQVHHGPWCESWIQRPRSSRWLRVPFLCTQ